MQRRRSVYEDRLSEHVGVAFGDEAAAGYRGSWGKLVGDRIGAGSDGRVVLEVGCGDAGVLLRAAERHPGTVFVGLDWKYRALYHAAGRIKTAGLRNVVLVRARAQELTALFGRAELDEVWLFHPDPCDGRNGEHEHAQRLVSEEWLLQVAGTLRRGGLLTLKTDHPGYYQATLAILGEEQPGWFEVGLRGGRGDRSGLPKTKWKEVVGRETLPGASERVRGAMEVVVRSADYWRDAAAQAATAGRGFWGEMTGFEERFRRQGLPIYCVEARLR